MTMKRLRVIIPTLQVLLVTFVFIWQHILDRRYIDQPDTIQKYSGTALQMLVKLDFPLVVLWSPIGYLMNVALSSSYLSLPSGPLGVALIAVADVVILASVAVFWYFVVAEIEARKKGSSTIRLKRGEVEIVKTVVFVTVGIGAIGYACWDADRLFLLGRLNHNLYWSGMVNAILGGAILLIWAVVLIKVSIQDLRIAVGKKNAPEL